MRIHKTITKNFLRVAALQLVLLGMLTVIVPSNATVSAFPSGNPADNNQQDDNNKQADNKNQPKSKTESVAPSAKQSNIAPAGLPKATADTNNVRNILQIVFGIIGAFALLNITLSGFKYITAAGNEQKVSEAKNGIVYSVLGLMIAISAEAIVAFVVHGTT